MTMDKKKSEGNYASNLKDGEWSYWEANGELKGVEYHKDGNLIGEAIDAAQVEELEEEETIEEKEKVEEKAATKTEKRVSAPVLSTVNWNELRGGFRKTYQGQDYTGHAIKYYDSGKIELRARYRNGNRYGEWVWYYENGSIKKKEFQ